MSKAADLEWLRLALIGSIMRTEIFTQAGVSRAFINLTSAEKDFVQIHYFLNLMAKKPCCIISYVDPAGDLPVR